MQTLHLVFCINNCTQFLLLTTGCSAFLSSWRLRSNTNMLFPAFSMIALLTAVTSAVPVPEADAATVGVYLCTGYSYTGHCVDIKSPSGTCVPLASDLNNQVSSLGPDGSALCYFYDKPNCDSSGTFFHLSQGVYNDLRVTPRNGPAGSTADYDNIISSYACFA